MPFWHCSWCRFMVYICSNNFGRLDCLTRPFCGRPHAASSCMTLKCFPSLEKQGPDGLHRESSKIQRILQEHLCHQPRSYSGRISSIIFLYEHSMDFDIDIYILCLTGSVVASDTAAWGKSDVWHCDAWRRTSTTAVAGLCRRVL